MPTNVGVVIKADGGNEFANSMKKAAESAKQAKQSLKELESEYKGNANSLAALTAKQEQLEKAQSAYARALSSAKAGQTAAVKNYKECGKALEQLEKELEEAKKAQADLEKAGDTSSKAYKSQVKEVERLEKAVEKQATEYDKASVNISKWDSKVNKAESDVKKSSKAVDQNAKYIDEAKQSADQCATSIDRFGKEMKEAGNDAQDAAEQTKSFGDKIKDGFALGAGALGAKALSEVGRKAAEAAKYVVEVGSEFEASMSKVEALSGASGSTLDALKDKASELGRNTMFSASEAADALSNMALAGWDANEMLSGIDGVLDLAASSGMDLASAADAVAGYLAAFNMEASESGHLADMMATAQAKSKTTATQLAEAYGNCATNMTQAGQSAETTTALLEGLASVNDTGSAAGTKLSAVMSQITKKMKDGKITIGNYGVAVKDSQGNFRDMVDIIADVEKATEGMTDAERQEVLQQTFNRQSMAGINELLAVGSEKLREYKKDLETSDGAASRMAGTVNDNFKGAVKELNSATEGLGNALYDQVSGPLTGAVDIATGLINGITDAITPQKTELDAFIENTKAMNEQAQQAIDNAKGALEQGETDVLSLEASADFIKEMNEQFGIFAEADISGVQGKVETAAEGLKEPLQQIGTDAGTAADNLVGIGDAEVTTPEGIATVQSDLTTAEEGISSTAENIDTAISGIGDAEVTTPDGVATLSKDVETANTAIGEDATAIKDSLTGISEAEVTAPEGLEEAKEAIHDIGKEVKGAQEEMNELDAFRLENAVHSLAKTIPEIGEAWDANTRKLNMSEADFNALIERHKIAIKQMALESARAKAVEAQVSADLAQRMAQNALDDVFKRAGEEVGKTITSVDELNTAVANFEINRGKGNYSNLVGYQEEARKATKELKKANKAVEESAGIAEETDAAYQQLAKDYGIADLEAAKTAVSTRDAANAAGDLEDAEAEALANQRIAEIASAHESAAERIRSAYDSIKESIKSSFDFDLGSEWDGGLDETVEKMTANLESQIQGMQDYATNLEIVKDHVGKEISPEFMAYLEGMGRDGANILAHIVKTFEQDNGSEVVQGLSDKYMQALNMQDDLAKVGAANVVALKAKAGEFASAAEDWANLSGVVDSLKGSGAELSDATLSAFTEAVDTAQAVGVMIPEGLMEGIESAEGDTDAAIAHATDLINAAIEGQGTELLAVAREVGINVPDGIAAAISEGGDGATDAMASLLSQILSAASEAEGEAEAAAESVSDSFASGIESASGTAEQAGTELGSGASTGAGSKTSEMSSAGSQAGSQFTSGVRSQSSYAWAAGSELAQAARGGAASVGGFSSIGYNLAAGVASGIRSGQSDVVTAAVSMVSAAARAAKNAAEIRSPSKKWKNQIGVQLGKGVALGIKQSTKDTTEAATAQMNNTLAALQLWVANNKKKIGGTGAQLTENITYAWQKLADIELKNKFGISSKKTENKKTVNKTAKEFNDDVYKAAQTYINNVKALYDISDKDQLDYWKKVRASLKRGTQAWYDATETIRQLQKTVSEQAKQAAAEARAAILSNAETRVSELKEANKLSVLEEFQYWQKIRDQLKKGSAEWKAATQYIRDCKRQIGTFSVAENVLSNYQTYYDMSLRAEMQYWDEIRHQYTAGTSARIEADANYFAAAEKVKEKLKDIEDEYADKIAETNKKYADAVKARKDQIMGAYDLFDYFESSSASGKELLFNIQTQAAGYEEWSKSIDELAAKGILSDDLMQQLMDKGPNSIAAIKALLTLTTDELKAYQKAYDQKEAAAQKQAEKENKDLKDEVAKEIKSLEISRSKDLEDVKRGISDDLLKLASNIRNYAEDQTSALVAAFTASGAKSGISVGSAVNSNVKEAAGLHLNDEATKKAKAAYDSKVSKAESAVNSAQKSYGAAKKSTEAAKKALTTATNALSAAQKTLKTVNANKKSTKADKTAAQKAVDTATTNKTKKKTAYDKALAAEKQALATLKAKQKALEELQKKGYRSGSRRLSASGMVWMDEDLASVGAEMLIRKSDNAILTRADPGDTIIPANLANNLFKWGAINPDTLNAASMTALNNRLMEGYRLSYRASEKQNAQLEQMLSLMEAFMPYLADRMTAPIISRDAASVMSGDISREMGARLRRVRR